MGEEKEKKELVLRFGAYWDERCVPLCDVCYTQLWPEKSGDNYAYCNRCGDSKKLCDYSGETLTIEEVVVLMKAEKEIMGQEAEKEIMEQETEEETRVIGNGMILHNINDVLYEVDAIKARLDSMDLNIRDNKNLLLSDIGWRVTELSKAVDTQTDIVCNKVRECRDYLSYEINKAMTEIDRNIVSSVIEHKALYPPKNVAWQKIVGFFGLITFSFFWSIVITSVIIRFFD